VSYRLSIRRDALTDIEEAAAMTNTARHDRQWQERLP
jgi:hypothetical protein